jgi:hypothetical protein
MASREYRPLRLSKLDKKGTAAVLAKVPDISEGRPLAYLVAIRDANVEPWHMLL